MPAPFRIGFPIACVDDEKWQYVVTKPVKGSCDYGWIDAESKAFRKLKSAERSKIGLGEILDRTLDGLDSPRLRFYVVDPESHEIEKVKLWSGKSGTAAMLLSLVGQGAPTNTPIVLISCGVLFSNADDYRGAVLQPVGTSQAVEENRKDLLNKWDAATNEPDGNVLALVLHDDDIACLPQELQEEVLPLTGTLFQQLGDQWKRTKMDWKPKLVRTTSDLVNLALALGINSAPFLPTNAKETRFIHRPEERDGRATWSTEANQTGEQPSTTPERKAAEGEPNAISTKFRWFSDARSTPFWRAYERFSLVVLLICIPVYALISWVPRLRFGTNQEVEWGPPTAKRNSRTRSPEPESPKAHDNESLSNSNTTSSLLVVRSSSITGSPPQRNNYSREDFVSDTCSVARFPEGAFSEIRENWRRHLKVWHEDGIIISGLLQEIREKPSPSARCKDDNSYARVSLLRDIIRDSKIQEEVKQLPKTLPYFDKKLRKGTKNVPPAIYLFNPRGVAFGELEAQGITDAYSLLVVASRLSFAFCKFDVTENLSIKACNSGLVPKRALQTIYRIIRKPTPAEEEHLLQIAAILPEYIVDSVLDAYDREARTAQKLIQRNPSLYCGFRSWLPNQPGEYSTGRAKDYTKPLPVSRRGDGELVISGHPECYAVFAPRIEFSTSSLAKFLFRRGRMFIESSSRLISLVRQRTMERNR